MSAENAERDDVEAVARALDPDAWMFHDDPKWRTAVDIPHRIAVSVNGAQAAINILKSRGRYPRTEA